MKSCHWLKINSYNIFPHFFKDPFPGKKKRKSFGGNNEDDALIEGLFFFRWHLLCCYDLELTTLSLSNRGSFETWKEW